MRGLKKNGATIAAGIAFTLMLPLMCAAVANCLPSAAEAVYFAASTSAKLTSHDFTQDDKTEEVKLAVPAEAIADKPLVPEKKKFAVDDSMMLSYGELNIPNSSNEELIVDDKQYDVGPKPYPESLESRDGTIAAVSYGVIEGDSYINLDNGQVRNITSVSNEDLLAESRLVPDFEIERNGEPQILIMHTHATESYEPYERDFYDSSFNSRTTDPTMNMIAVGDEIAAELEAAGIAVLHDTTLHDYPSYNGSYDRSRETVQKYLDEYPSIKIVLDVHRDAIERDSGDRIAPVAEIDGKNAAQVMIISGCDDGTMDMPDYMKNFRFAALLQNQLESDWEGLTRPVLFDYRKYNQDMTTGSILIEVGGHANSIDQALYSGELIGKSLVNCLT
ncbi:MAG: stage II sporulation protein P [Oscillospiraceae bacterium]|nr:stage II sporulation protein P [Oscillospiraceae bacterium]